jgi:hypothetical protein
MLNALYITRKHELPDFEKKVTMALGSVHLRKLAVTRAVAATKPHTTPDLVVAGLGQRGAVVEVKELRRAFPKIPIVITSGDLSEETSAEIYRAGATAVVPLGALGDAIANLAQVVETGKEGKAGALKDATMVEAFHDRATGRLDAKAVARGLGISMSGLAKAAGLTPSALSKRPRARAAQDALREIEFAVASLRRLLESDARVRAWLNAPHPDLGGRAPLALLTDGSAKDLADYVRGALSGQPT